MASELFAEKYRIKSARLRNYDYSSNGMYFVTICTKNREYFFGEMQNEGMMLNDVGRVAHRYWSEIPDHFECVELSDFVIMSNHVHGIVIIRNPVETRDLASLRMYKNTFGPLKPKSLQSMIHAYKSSVKRWCNKNNHEYFAWQSRFHEHIIRSDNDLDNAREYIITNPVNWDRDRNNPAHFPEKSISFRTSHRL